MPTTMLTTKLPKKSKQKSVPPQSCLSASLQEALPQKKLKSEIKYAGKVRTGMLANVWAHTHAHHAVQVCCFVTVQLATA